MAGDTPFLADEKAVLPSYETKEQQQPQQRDTGAKICRQRMSKSCLTRHLFLFLALFLATTLYFGPLQSWHAVSWLSYYPFSPPAPNSHLPASHGLDFDALKQILLETPSAERARDWNKYYASGPHLTGKNISQAVWTQEKWQEWGLETEIVSYDVYLNYPRDHRLALLEVNATADGTVTSSTVTFEATLEEDVLPEDSTSGLEDRVPVFHGYSASGNVTARFVYANFGTYQDYEDLLAAGVELEGKIVLVKYGGVFRGLKIKRAEELGAVGVLIYSDPQEDGSITEENGFAPYPDGPARNPSAVQRGSVEYLSFAPGDPTTIGYPSTPGVERGDTAGHIPRIPSLPISYKEALPLLRALNGLGPKAADLGARWQGSALGYKGVEYNVGPSPAHVVLNLYNDVEYKITPMWNVIGTLRGLIPDEVIVVGNHRDAWIAGGAVDPNSGSASMNEVIRSFSEAVARGWRPLRTIVFASWDGEEYGLLGSTEWVEDKLSWLQRASIAYLNVDVSTAGTQFSASASPLLNQAIYWATSQVASPNQTVPGQSTRDVWDGEITTMGSGSDFTAFQDYAGIPSLNIGFDRSPNDPVYHYHSNYDSFDWVDKFGDPTWSYHTACAKVLGLMTAYLSENAVIGFSAVDYARGLERYVDSVRFSEAYAKGETAAAQQQGESDDDDGDCSSARHRGRGRGSGKWHRHRHYSLKKLDKAVRKFHKNALEFDRAVAAVNNELQEKLPWWQLWRRVRTLVRVHALNRRFQRLEQAFLHQPGLDGRNWFKHVIFAPGLWTGYSGAVFPSLVESLEVGDWRNAMKWQRIIAGKVREAAAVIDLEHRS
ncbi:hypothetical protein KEM52_001578 [Ascosphaera acerosa]|nr:hypothetical protein KEM52_001578 [Ascosphaera acerosa]